MPNRVWRARHRPPRTSDHLAAHFYEVSIAVVGVLVGVGMLVTALIPGASFSATLDAMHILVASSVGALMIVGGGSIIAGLLDDSDDLIDGWRKERFGLILSAFGWLGWGISVGYSLRGASITWVLALLVGTMHLIRLWLTFADEDATKKSIAGSGTEVR